MRQKNSVPFWDDTFLAEVESRTVEQGMLIWGLSGAAFAVRTPGAMIYLDPFFGGDPVEGPPGMYRTTAVPIDPARITLADAVLVSHAHYDHCHEETLQAMASATPATFYGPESAMSEMAAYGLPEKRTRRVSVGDTLVVGDATVTVLPAYDEYEPQAVTFVIESSGVRAFFSGDSSGGAAFGELGRTSDLDIAMLSFGRTWYMDAGQMLDAADSLSPKLLLPYHWEIWRGHSGDVLELGRLLERRKPEYSTELLLVGEYMHYLPGGAYTKGP